jgi:hypothetical protein
MAAKSTLMRAASDVAIPAAIMVVLAVLPILNYLLDGGLLPHGLIYLIIRLAVVGTAGFVVTHRTKLGIGAAALTRCWA